MTKRRSEPRKRKEGQSQIQGEVRSDLRTTPSQAEGERATVEEDLCIQEARENQTSAEACAPAEPAPEPLETRLPSQAEGNRETVEDDLVEKGQAD